MPKGIKRTEDEILKGAVVLWSAPRRRGKRHYEIKVKYLCCGKTAWKEPSGVAELRGRKKVWCSDCRPHDYSRPAVNSTIILGGRRYWHIDFLSKEDRKLALKMGRQGTSGNYIAEHRLNAAKKIGRPLQKKDSVHHDNGDKLDNSFENLIVIPQSLHKLTHWEVLRELARCKLLLGEI